MAKLFGRTIPRSRKLAGITKWFTLVGKGQLEYESPFVGRSTRRMTRSTTATGTTKKRKYPKPKKSRFTGWFFSKDPATYHSDVPDAHGGT